MKIPRMTLLIIGTGASILVLLFLFFVISAMTLSTKSISSTVAIETNLGFTLLTHTDNYFAPADFYDAEGNLRQEHYADFQTLQTEKEKFGECASQYPFYSVEKKSDQWIISQQATNTLFSSLLNSSGRELPLYLAIKSQNDKRQTVSIVKITKNKAEVIKQCGDDSSTYVTLRSITPVKGSGWNIRLSLTTSPSSGVE